MENEWQLELGFPLALFTTGYAYSDKYFSDYHSQVYYAIFLSMTKCLEEVG